MSDLDDLAAALAAGDDDGSDEVTLTCPECGEGITGKRKGGTGGGATWKLGLHRRNKHGIQGKGKQRQRAGAPTAEQFEARPVLSSVVDIASVMGKGTGTPTAKELSAGFGRAVTLTSLFAAGLVVETDGTIPDGPAGDQVRDKVIDYLAIPDETAQNIVAPIGKAFAGTKLNDRYGRGIVDNVDVLASVFELGTIGLRWKRVIKMRAGDGLGTLIGLTPTPGMPGMVPPAAAQSPAAGVPVPTTPTSPAPTAGHVVTAADLQQAKVI